MIPHTQLSPSVICLGTALFGSDVDESLAYELLDTFFEKDGNFLDTAHGYGEWVHGGMGLSEKVIGRWLKARGLREQVIIATKGAQPLASTPHISRLSHDEIVSDLDASLQCLQIENIDLYWLHRDDPSRPVSDILQTLNEQVSKGKIRYFGCSNWRRNRIEEAIEFAVEQNIHGFIASQLMWSFAAPNPQGIADKTLVFMDEQMLEFHRKTGLTALAYTSQARGFFTKLKNNPAALSERLRNTYVNAENVQRLRRLEVVSEELSFAIPTLLLAYLTNQSFPTFPIFASTNKQQLLENLQASDVELSANTLRYLEEGKAIEQLESREN